MRMSPALSFLALSTLLLAASAAANDYAYQKPVDGLDAEYYHKSCPDMEGIVQRAVKKAFAADYTVAAGLIRLFFHDFAVRVYTTTHALHASDMKRTHRTYVL